jgi:hypothetical protein
MARILPRRWSQKIPPEGIPNESPPKAVGMSGARAGSDRKQQAFCNPCFAQGVTQPRPLVNGSRLEEKEHRIPSLL